MKQLSVISYYSFKEVMRSRVLHLTLILAACIALVSYVASEFTYGATQKVALDSGLGLMSMANIAISIMIGSGLMPMEIESRTIFIALSRPVRRHVFLLGKFFGLAGVMFINTIILSLVSLTFFKINGGVLDKNIFLSIVMLYFECTILLAFVICLSLFVNRVLTVIGSITVYGLGYTMNSPEMIAFIENRDMSPGLIRVLRYTLPDFSIFNIKEYLIYQISLPDNFFINAFIYFVFYCGFLLTLACMIFNKKDLN